RKGGIILNARNGKKVKVPRLVRRHSNETENVDCIGPGDICAIFGVGYASGDMFIDSSISLTMASP
ncbi:hypothetical protein M378DRAFT_89904, partial [Amanita muscaria Koide BX008]